MIGEPNWLWYCMLFIKSPLYISFLGIFLKYWSTVIGQLLVKSYFSFILKILVTRVILSCSSITQVRNNWLNV